MNASDVSRYADMFAAMGAEPRLQIMRLLLKAHPDGLVVGELQSEVGGAASTLSHHLEKLRHEDLVSVAREGTFLRYRANTDRLRELLGFLYTECCSGRAWRRRRPSFASSAGLAEHRAGLTGAQGDHMSNSIKDEVQRRYGQHALPSPTGGPAGAAAGRLRPVRPPAATRSPRTSTSRRGRRTSGRGDAGVARVRQPDGARFAPPRARSCSTWVRAAGSTSCCRHAALAPRARPTGWT